MKKKSTLTTLVLLLGLGCYTVLTTSYSGGFTSYSSTQCTTCHTFGQTVSISINGLPAAYDHGQTYPISVTVSSLGPHIIAGFQLRTNIGTLTTSESGITAYADGISMGHNTPKVLSSGAASFSMNWTAPTSGNTAANFAAQGIAANGNNSNTGDGGALATVSNVVLPVRFIDFSAIANTSSIEIHFETMDEENIKIFKVERSLNGKDFESIKTIQPKGNGLYHFTDQQVKKNLTYYYRINEVASNNKSSYSRIKSARIGSDSELVIFPTLLRNQQAITIQGLNTEFQTDFSLYNLLGKQIMDVKNIDRKVILPSLPNGLYFITLKQSGKVIATQKIQIQ